MDYPHTDSVFGELAAVKDILERTKDHTNKIKEFHPNAAAPEEEWKLILNLEKSHVQPQPTAPKETAAENATIARLRRKLLNRQVKRASEQVALDLDLKMRAILLNARQSSKLHGLFSTKRVNTWLGKTLQVHTKPEKGDGEDDHGEERRIARRKRASTQIAPIPRLDQMPPPTSHMDGHDFFHPSSLDPSGMLLMDSQLHEVNFDPSRAAHHTAPPRAVSQPIPPITHNPTKRRKKASAEPFRSGGPAGLTSDEDEEEKPKTASAEMERNLWRTVQSKGRSTVSTRQRNAAADNLSFLERLMGDVNHRKTTTLITSPWSSTILKPFIRRDDVSVPIPSGLDALWFLEEHDKLAHRVPIRVRLLRELLHKRNGNIPGWLLPTHTIDYCYLRADMVDQVNRLLCNEFWPGIDISESLVYPENTVVVMFGAMVVGAGFITPSGYITYIALHKEWQGYHIGGYMLYHLMMTVKDKDITLHVSATNPAMIMYQKFCFKVEQYLKNFYDKYLPADSTHCKDAFFLRLRRR